MPQFSYITQTGKSKQFEATDSNAALSTLATFTDAAPTTGVQEVQQSGLSAIGKDTGAGTSESVRNESAKINADKETESIEQQKELERLKREAEIKSLKDELSGGITAPTTPNYKELYDTLRTEQNVGTSEAELMAVRKKKSDIEQSLQEFGRVAVNEAASSGFGVQPYVQQRAELQRNLDTTVREEANVIDTINMKNSLIETVMGFEKLDYETARQEYEKEFNKNLQIQQQYNQRQDKEQSNAQAYLSSLASLINNSENGWSSVDDGMKTNIRTAELKAGWVPGTFEEYMSTKSKANLLATINGYDASGSAIVSFIYSDENGMPGIVQTVRTGGAKSSDSTSPNILTKTQYSRLQEAGIDNDLADRITAAILSGFELDEIRQYFEENNIDPIILDLYDNVVGINSILKSK